MKFSIALSLLLLALLQNACVHEANPQMQKRAEILHARSGDPAAPLFFK